jgi:hypothetical protein
MSTHINYADISRADRIRLTGAAYRSKPSLRVARGVSIFLSIWLSAGIANHYFPRGGAPMNFVWNLTSMMAVGLVLVLGSWEIYGRRQMRAEIERLRNA